MSDSNKVPKAPPPDDFSKTTPHVNLPEDAGGQADWDKTNYNMPKQPAPDDWGKTVANIKPIDTGGGQDLDKTFFPGAKTPSTPEWGMTEARVDVSGADFGTKAEDFGGNQGYEKTTPYFQLPDAEKAKYQNLPPTPAEAAEEEQKAIKEKGGIPAWFWVLAGLLVMFFFAIAVLGVVYFFIIRDTGFEATVKGAPPGSTVRVNGSPWGVTDESGSIKLPILKEGETKKIEIIHPSYTCQPAEVRSQNGVVTPNPIIAKCSQVTVKPDDVCTDFQPGDDDKAERCYNAALDALPDPFTPEALVKALSILIINFDSGKYDVPPVRLAALQKGAGFITKLQKMQPGVVLEVGGHTDNVGNDASNQKLSENRAEAVKNALVKFGVPAEMLQTRGYGSSKPKADNNTERGKFLNRRIEYSVVRK